jgi:hypothetical protein
MSVNQDFGPRLRVWLHERLAERPDPYPILDEVLSQLPTTPQRRHRWWPFTRSAGRFSMFSARNLVAAAVPVVLMGTFVLSSPLADRQDPDLVPVADSPSPGAEVLFDAVLQTEVLPPGFVKVEAARWILAPGSDSLSSLANEGLRGLIIIVDSGAFLIEPAADASVWRAPESDPVVARKGEAVSLHPGDAIFLPAIPGDEVDEEAMLRLANLGTEKASAYTFHTHDQDGGPSLGSPEGVSFEGWDSGLGLWPYVDSFNGTDVHFRLSRLTGEPGTKIAVPESPGIGLYYVESGTLEQVTTGPEREYSRTWEPGHRGGIVHDEVLEKTLEIAGDGPAPLLELAVVPGSP